MCVNASVLQPTQACGIIKNRGCKMCYYFGRVARRLDALGNLGDVGKLERGGAGRGSYFSLGQNPL